MLTQDNVRPITSNGAECFVCDRRIAKGEPAIQVTFKLLVSVTKEMHSPVCATDLRDLIHQRIQEPPK